MHNTQREAPVNTARMTRLARRAVRRLKIRTPGILSVTFIGSRRMRTLNKRFLNHDRTTDVLSFRYAAKHLKPEARNLKPETRNPKLVVGEILIAPRLARSYARTHEIPYTQELSRYVVHGLLHWLGHEDDTATKRNKMRKMENQLLDICHGSPPRRGKGQETGGGGKRRAPRPVPRAPV